MEIENRIIATSVRFRPNTKMLLKKLSRIYDRTASDTIEQLIIADSKRYGLIESREIEIDSCFQAKQKELEVIK
jgi:hypothetical protein